MIYKRLLKLTLPGLLLAAAVSAYAEGDQVVQLANGVSKTWAEFAEVINNPSSVQVEVDKTDLEAAQKAVTDAETAVTNAEAAVTAALSAQDNAKTALETAQAAYETKEADLSSWTTQRSSLQAEQGNVSADLTVAQGITEKVTVDWLLTAYNSAVVFKTAYDADDQTSTCKIWYQVGTTGRKKPLIISFANPNETGWTEASQSEFYDAFENNSSLDVTIGTLKVYFGKDANGEYNYKEGTDGMYDVTSFAGNLGYILQYAVNEIRSLSKEDGYSEYKNQKERDDLAAKLATLKTSIADYTDKIKAYTETVGDNGKTQQATLKDAYTDAQKAKEAADADVTAKKEAVSDRKADVVTRKSTLDAEQKAYDDAVAAGKTTALENYKTVTLTGDVTANTAIKDYDGVIHGEGHVITLGEGVTSLFGTFRGTMGNAAVNGKIFQAQNGSSFTNVAYWAANAGAFYDEGNSRTNVNGSLGELGFVAREYFGVDFVNNALAVRTDDSKVYGITVYEPNSSVHHYVQTRANGKFYTESKTELAIPENRFAKSETFDLQGQGYKNLIYDGKCEEVVINDKSATSFYCPEDITAGTVTLDRQFSEGQNVVCLPFELNYGLSDKIAALCKYDKETPTKFWFKKVAESIPANTPVLLVSTEGSGSFTFDSEELKGISLKKTDSTQLVMDEGDAEEPSKCYGLFKKATREEFQGGASESHKVYGFTKKGTFSPAAEGVNLPAFRIAIYSDIATQTGELAAPRRIGILDEKGVEITDDLTTGVESVSSETSGLSVAAGSGEIIITSDADYGRVAVYTLDGRVATVAEVMAGTTTVSIESGVYIVMGKKVLVK